MWLKTGSQTVLAFVAASRRRTRNIAIATVLILVFVGVGIIAFTKYSNAQSAQRRIDSYSALHQCLLGASPATGEAAGARFRKSQLAALTGGETRRATLKEKAWPARCATFAHQLSEATKKRDGFEDVTTNAASLGEALDKSGAYWTDLTTLIDATLSSATKAEIARVEKGDVDGPPAASQALEIEGLGKNKAVTNKAVDLNSAVHTEPHRAEAVRFIVDDKQVDGAPLLCTFTLQEGACSSLPAAITGAATGGYQLRGTTGKSAKPLVFAGGDGSGGVFVTTDGSKIATATSLGGWTTANGHAALLTVDGDRLGLVRWRDGRSSTGRVSTRLKLKNAARDAQLLWGQVLAVGASGDEHTVAAGEVGERGQSRLTDVGTIAPAAIPIKATKRPRITGCKSGDLVAARIANGKNEYFSFHISGSWTKPTELQKAGGIMSCGNEGASIVRIDRADSPTATMLTHSRCKPGKCTSTRLKMVDILASELGLAPTSLLQAVDLSGNLLMVWAAGQRGGVRMRLAPTAQIATATDVILYDDLMQGSKVISNSTLVDIKLLPADGFAVLLLNTKAGLFALRVTPDGKVTAAL